MKKMTIHPLVTSQSHVSTSPPLQKFDVHDVNMTNPKCSQQPIGKNKNKGNKGGGNNNNENKYDTNARGVKKENKKVRFPCKL
jgi:hypothetical protein